MENLKICNYSLSKKKSAKRLEPQASAIHMPALPAAGRLSADRPLAPMEPMGEPLSGYVKSRSNYFLKINI
jgi:hypothetical protein